MREIDAALRLARKVLDTPSRDPNDDLSVLSRWLLRSHEHGEALRAASAFSGLPRIFVEVLLPVGNTFARSRKEIPLFEYREAVDAGGILVLMVETALAELGCQQGVKR